MRRRRQRLDLNAEINVVSLIDVMMLLMVIFMITAPMMQGGVDISLPRAEARPLDPKSGLVSVAWTDIRSAIAFYNVRHSHEVTGEGVPLDVYYMNDLGPSAIPALDELLATAQHADRDRLAGFRLTREELAQKMVDRDTETGTAERRPESWHGWTWRSERLEAYLLAHPFAPAAPTAID